MIESYRLNNEKNIGKCIYIYMIKLLPLPWFAKTLLLQRRTFVLANKKTITKRYEENERYQNINNQKRKQKQSYDLYDTSRTHQNKGYQPQSIKNNNKNTRTQPSQTSHNYPPKNVRSDAKNRYTSHH